MSTRQGMVELLFGWEGVTL